MMIKTVKLAGFEFRRFKGPWAILGLLFVLLVPTVFAGLYLWSNEDPYGKRDQVPVAVVNLDQPAPVEGTTVAAGDRLVRELAADPIFAWNFVDQDTAEQGLADGTYYMIVEIPPDFSANLVSGSGDLPQRASVNLRLNDATGYLTELLVASAQPRLEAAINRAAIGAYLESVFANLDTIRTAIRSAADSAAKLATDTATALTQATDLSTAVSTAKQSSSAVVGDLATAKSSSAALVTSAGDAKAGSAAAVTALGSATTAASNLSSSADSAASSASSLAGSVGPAVSAINSAAPALGQSAANVEAATQDTSDLVTQSLNPTVTELNRVVGTLSAQDQAKMATAMQSLNTVNSQLGQSSSQAAAQAVAVNSSAQTVTGAAADLTGAGSELTGLAATTATVSSGMSGLYDNVSSASGSAATVDSAVNGIASQATDLDSSIGTAQLAAQTTDDTLTPAETNASGLVSTLTTVNAAAGELSTGLSDSAERFPTLAPGEQADTEQVLSSPADLTVLIDNPAVVYGRGMAPITFGLAIWVFALAVFLLLRPVAGGALLARASSLRIAVAGWLPPLLLGIVGSLLLFGIAWLGLHLDPVNAGAAVGVIALGVACFTAITHLLRTWLGAAGTAIAFVLLMVQFTASGGLYPMPTTPAPFQVIERGLPMTYLVDALRISFTGGVYQRLWVDVGVLAGFTVVALALSVLVVHRRRTLRLSDLQPMAG
ncbi:YhgE/Pip family protein [Nakamurella sp.]|uniref:YhgE/Pip family protein n=1 Tax=Nakamurella sp. TaxID=1869182 RepID=UPI003B3BD857